MINAVSLSRIYEFVSTVTILIENAFFFFFFFYLFIIINNNYIHRSCLTLSAAQDVPVCQVTRSRLKVSV